MYLITTLDTVTLTQGNNNIVLVVNMPERDYVKIPAVYHGAQAWLEMICMYTQCFSQSLSVCFVSEYGSVLQFL